ncbi:SpvB/TcaC N-terminal domain-containing protein [Isoptericola sp. b408]|uniref:SpvB/TcaC N-terminal domain-containing protein n=1 Tax=Isoptericola sp. b408 TaxID=3064653 RepID=UPI002712A142|nr:SpvB/TcaC N-terminal domain-containing protein [Isoptericola sp. b408]MDO8150871.1 SpvB/TcaC N-terminal domain-containing protein [Isoptericola sp. b408]
MAAGPARRERRTAARRWTTATAMAASAALVVTLTAAPGVAEPLADPAVGTLDDVPGTSPDDLGGVDLAELDYGDPTEALSLVEPPDPTSAGAAQMSYPVLVPPGRAGVEPDLDLTYDSSGGNGWLGLGWDLDAGAIAVDPTYGAPRFAADVETETYALDGARLFPHSIRDGGDYGAREAGPRTDFVRQVETEYERIVRHGDTPGAYWWQVTDKDGNDRWYGGDPDGQGQVLTTAAGNAFHWPLTYVEDISGNVMRFEYDTATGVGYGSSSSGPGLEMYLREITYTGFDVEPDSEGVVDDPPYSVYFLRDGDVGGTTVASGGSVDARPDPLVDASGGAPVVTADLLREIQVRYHAPGARTDDGPGEIDAGNLGELLGGYALEYKTGPFDKSLVKRVGQFGGDGVVEAWHRMKWFDDVPRDGDAFDLFGDPVRWDTDTDSSVSTGSNVSASSALATSFRGGAEGGSYIGFNPVAPSKIGSFGGSFNLSGGNSEDVTTFMDMDGDSLPDRVWVENGAVKYARNLSRPGDDLSGHADRFGAPMTIDEAKIGTGTDFGVDLHAEFYPVASIQVGGSFGFDWADRYFSDVNADGRPDLIKKGSSGWQVFFSVYDESDGSIEFVASSAGTAVPMGSFSSELASAEPEGVDELLEASAPRYDTVRRWVAPYDGVVDVTGTATLADAGNYDGDGVRVMIETLDTTPKRPLDETLTGASPSVDHAVSVSVDAGDEIFFRTHVIDNGTDDLVEWAPAVTYSSVGSGVPTSDPLPDAQGRDVLSYDAAEDFTTFGRDGGRTLLPNPGEATLTVTLERTGLLTDDVEVVASHGLNAGSTEGTSSVVTLTPDGGAEGLLGAGPAPGDEPEAPPGEDPIEVAPTSVELTYTFDVSEVGQVAEPAGCFDDGDAEDCDSVVDNPDWLALEVASDSPVDPRSLALDVQLELADPVAESGPNGEATPDDLPADAVLPSSTGPVVIPSVRVFSVSDEVTGPYLPWSPDAAGTFTLDVDVVADRIWDYLEVEPDDEGWASSPAVVTVKSEDEHGIVGVVAKSDGFTVEHNHDDGPFVLPSEYRVEGETTLDFDAEPGQDYWVEVSLHDAPMAAHVLENGSLTVVATSDDDEDDKGAGDLTARLVAPDVQSVFASGNRGWTAAGYDADHPDIPRDDPDEPRGDALLQRDHFELEPEGVDDFDEDTEIPDAPDATEVAGEPGDLGSSADKVADSFDKALPYFPLPGPDGGAADRWRAASEEGLFVTATGIRSTRIGEEIAVVDPGGTSGGSTSPGSSDDARPAPRVLTIDGDFNAALGLGPASLSGAIGGGRTVTDFQDLNGDGFPDVRSGSDADYTGPRGGSLDSGSEVENTISTAVSVGGGLGGSPVSIEGSEQTKTSAGSPTVGAQNGTSKNKTRGMSIGLGFSIQGQWTNPFGDNTDGLDGGVDDLLPDGDSTGQGVQVSVDLDDVNGDGVTDLVETWSESGVQVALGTGYGYADPVKWSGGVFEASESVSGALSGGFQLNAYEFGGGVGGAEGGTLSEASWIDVDGDGVLDRMVYADGNESAPKTVFGAADGNGRTAKVLGTYPSPDFGVGDLTIDNRADLARSTSVNGGFDFTVSVGPICLVACYVIINPGVHGGYERSRTVVDMTDMDGDGYLDVVESLTDEHVEVRLNQAGRTNMLKAVDNPLGGAVRVDYERTGNSIVQPNSLWVMSEVEYDDGRPGDGTDVQRREFSYSGDAYDHLHRTMLGFDAVEQREYDVDADPADGPSYDPGLQRITRWTYRNDTPFDDGLAERVDLLAPGDTEGDDRLLERTDTTWELAHVVVGEPGAGEPANGDEFTGVVPDVGDPARTALFDLALAPRLTSETFTRFDADGDGHARTTDFTYDGLGNTLTAVDHAETGTTGDDTTTVTTYPPCTTPRYGGDDSSWVQVPATVAVHAGTDDSGEVLKYRDGSLDLCGNAVPIRIVETQGQDVCGDDVVAVTEMAFEPYGNYDAVRYPANVLTGETDSSACGGTPPALPEESVFEGCVPAADAPQDEVDAATRAAEEQRYCVDYVYDDHRVTDIAQVTDSHGVTSTATYDYTVGLPATTTDANGNTTEYCYDALGRIAAVATPRESGDFACDGSGSGPATVTYAYGGFNSDGHAWAAARHHDAVLTDGTPAADTLDTAAFVDGMARVVQRKRDAQVVALGDTPAMVVEGAVDFDALGREVREWYPVVEEATYPGGGDLPPGLTTYNTRNSSGDPADTHVPVTDPTQRRYDLLDRLTRVVLPDGSVERRAYDITEPPHLSHQVASVTVTDPLEREVQRFSDVRGAVLAVVESPAPTGGTTDGLLDALPAAGIGDERIVESARTGTTPLLTTYAYDPLARLTKVTDTAGAVSRYGYDMLDLGTSVETPDSGLLERAWTPAGDVAETVDEVRRAEGTSVVHAYDFDRLRSITYPDDTGDVEYTYGDELGAGAPGNSEGRVAREATPAVAREYAYDVDGNVSTEAVTRGVDPFGIGQDEPQPTWATRWQYDSLQRVVTLTYPGDDGGTGEVLHHEYDLGGQVSGLWSLAPQHDAYTVEGDPVPRPDREIVYVTHAGYDEFGEVRTVTTGTGVTTEKDYDPDRRFLTGIATDAAAQEQWDGTTSVARELQELRYSYDVVGNVTDVANALYDGGSAGSLDELGDIPANNLPGPAQQAYTYDQHYRLAGAEGRYVDRQEDRTYEYTADRTPNGNLVDVTQATATESTTGKGGGKGPGRSQQKTNSKKGDGSLPDSGSTDEPQCDPYSGSGGGSDNQDPESTYAWLDQQFDPDHPHQVVRAGGRSYEHDVNGNMTGWTEPCASSDSSELDRRMEWDAEDRLVEIGEDGNDTSYRYDADGNLVLERGPGGTYFFVNEAWRLENDGHRYAEIYLGTTKVASHRTAPAPQPPAGCDPLVDENCVCDPETQACACDVGAADPDGDGLCPPVEDLYVQFFHTDLQGSLRVVTDEVGSVFQYLEYLPSGQKWVAGQSRIKDTPYLFAGGWNDSTYKTVNFGERWYSWRDQRFLSTEPLLTEDPDAVVADPGLLSAYTYAAANPLRYVDSDGRAPVSAGQNFEKNKQGTFTVSDTTRANRPSPARFGQLLLSYDAAGQARQQKWQDASDKVDKFFTLLRFKASGSLRSPSIKLEGISLWDIGKSSDSAGAQAGGGQQGGAANGPNPGPGNAGNQGGAGGPAAGGAAPGGQGGQGGQAAQGGGAGGGGVPAAANRGRSASFDAAGGGGALPPPASATRPRSASF